MNLPFTAGTLDTIPALDSTTFSVLHEITASIWGLNRVFFLHRGQGADHYCQFPRFYLDRKHGNLKEGN